MYENTFVNDKTEDPPNRVQPELAEVRAAKTLHQHHRAQGLATLNMLFRSGSAPEPSLNGRYAGELLALDLAPGLNQFYEWLTGKWLPWLGKTFNAAQAWG
jgi:hypothetical protein